jgi:hypothetical protein
MDIDVEISKLPSEMRHLAHSLLAYAKHISKSLPVWENEQWVFRPENFVTFRIHYKNTTNITLYLRGEDSEFANWTPKTVRSSVPGYSKIIIESLLQVPEAFLAIQRAYQLFSRGRTRTKRTLTLAEATIA